MNQGAAPHRHVLTGHGVKLLPPGRHQQPGLQHDLRPRHGGGGPQAEGQAPPAERRAEAEQLEAAARRGHEGHGARGQEVGGVGVEGVQLGAVQTDPAGGAVGDDVPARHQLLPLHLGAGSGVRGQGSGFIRGHMTSGNAPAPPPSPGGGVRGHHRVHDIQSYS